MLIPFYPLDKKGVRLTSTIEVQSVTKTGQSKLDKVTTYQLALLSFVGYLNTRREAEAIMNLRKYILAVNHDTVKSSISLYKQATSGGEI